MNKVKDPIFKKEQNILVMDISAKKNLPEGHLQHYFIHVLCLFGTATFRMENKIYQLRKDDILIVLPSSGFEKIKYSRDFKATCLLVSFDLMSKNNPDIGWGIKAFLFSKENPVVSLSEIDVLKCLSNFSLLDERYKNEKHLFQMELVNLQLQMFIMEMWNIFSNEIDKRSISKQTGSLFERFLQLVQENCMEEREVDFYAGKLFITSKYLTEICKKSSGKTASEWIQNYTTQRLIILLQNKNLSFTQIADTLNFSSQTFFSRYVKKVLGVSPSEYRLRIG